MLSIAQRSCANRAADSIPLSGEEWACIGRLRDVVALIVLLVCCYFVEKSGLLVDLQDSTALSYPPPYYLLRSCTVASRGRL
jgi:hypothetical protein